MAVAYGFSNERQEIDFSNAPIAVFTAKFARWAGFRGVNTQGGGAKRKHDLRRELGLKLYNRPVKYDATAND